jgi:hypothetical protein
MPLIIPPSKPHPPHQPRCWVLDSRVTVPFEMGSGVPKKKKERVPVGLVTSAPTSNGFRLFGRDTILNVNSFAWKKNHFYRSLFNVGTSNLVKYGSHISPILFQSFFALIRRIVHLWSHFHHGVLGGQGPQSSAVLHLILRSWGEVADACLKKTITSTNERRKTTGTWWHAPCCSFNLVWIYFISVKRKSFIG